MINYGFHFDDDETNVGETPGISYQMSRNLMELKAALWWNRGRRNCGDLVKKADCQ